MFHNPIKLLKVAKWLRIISWYFLAALILGIGMSFQWLVLSFPTLPFETNHFSMIPNPGWLDWSAFVFIFVHQIISPIIYFLLLQGLAATTQFLLKYHQRITPTTD